MNRRDVLSALTLAGTAPGFAAHALGVTLTSSPTLARRAPESQGISSGAIGEFLDAVDAEKIELHSLMVLRHGVVVAEGAWAPYRLATPHDLYSASKTFTSTAIGFAMTDGRLKTSTKIVDLFPDKLPALIDDRLARLQVSHLLTMATGHDGLKSSERVTATTDWVRAFLAEPMLYEPGSTFLYENTASYMLSAIIQKLYRETLVEFLSARLFAPLGVPTPRWESCPLGINTGGWGLSMPSDAFARFGELYLDKGLWNGRQIVPPAWIAEASAAHIQQRPDLPVTVNGAQYSDPGLALAALKASSDDYQGYGFQIWRNRYDTYSARGAFGQFAIVMPELQAVIVTTAGELHDSRIFDLTWQHLLPAMQAAPLASSNSAQEHLRDRLGSLALACPVGRASSPAAESFAGRRFHLTENPLGVRALSFAWGQEIGHLSLDRTHGRITIPLGFGRWCSSRVDAPGLVPWMALLGKTVRPGEITIAGAYAWSDDETLTFRLCYTETPHHHRITVRRTVGGLTIETSDGFDAISHCSGMADDT